MSRKRYRLEKHHVIPRSRGGSDDLSNIVEIEARQHELYHQLFSNKTPAEILQYLNTDFWGSLYQLKIIQPYNHYNHENN